jgi:hypothetical protein
VPVIPATQKAEIRRLEVPGQLGQKKNHLSRKKLGMVECACHPSDSRKSKIGG